MRETAQNTKQVHPKKKYWPRCHMCARNNFHRNIEGSLESHISDFMHASALALALALASALALAFTHAHPEFDAQSVHGRFDRRAVAAHSEGQTQPLGAVQRVLLETETWETDEAGWNG